MARIYVLYLLLAFIVYHMAAVECRLKRLDFKVGVNVKLVKKEIESVRGVCITDECIKLAEELWEYVDFEKRPCTDFYDFVCGKYMRNNSIPHSSDNIKNFEYIYNLIDNNIDHLLASRITRENKINEKAVKQFYDSCMNMNMINRKGVAPLMAYLETYQGWPLLKGNNWDERAINMNVIMANLYEQGTNGLFRIYLGKDPVTKLEKIFISEPNAVFPSDYYKHDSPYRSHVEALVNYITDIGVYLSNETMRHQIRNSANKIKGFKASISVCITNQRNSRDANFKQVTLLEYDDNFGNVVFDLQAILNIFLARHANITNFDKVIVTEPKYMKCLKNVIKKKSKRDILDYLFWELIESLTYAMPQVYRDRRETFKENIDDYYDYSTPKEACLELLKANLIEALDAYYARTYTTKETKKRAKDMIRYIKRSFINLLKANTKIDYETKEMSIKKLRYMRELIGYPDYFENPNYFTDMFSVLTIDSRKSFIENLMTARRIHVNEGWRFFNLVFQPKGPRVAELNAFFNHYINSQEISAALLLPPFYSDNFPMYWNFGALGFTTAHEINHGFVMSGRRFDEHGNEYSFWSDRTQRAFDIKGECFKRQYDTFVVTQVNRTINGENTISENLADNNGVKLAYSAYVNWLKVNGDEPRLPGFNFTSKQMFFISFARYFCSKPNDDILNYLLDHGKHSASPFRVIGSLRNSVEFAAAFQCREGEPMNPARKCTYW